MCVLKIIHIAFVVLAGSTVCGVRRFLSGVSMALCLSNCCLIHRNCLSYILSCICMQPVRCLQPCTQPLIIYFYPALSSQPATFLSDGIICWVPEFWYRYFWETRRTLGRDEAPEHFFRHTVINSPQCQEFMVWRIFSVVTILLSYFMVEVTLMWVF